MPDLPTKVFIANEIRIWGLAAAALIAVVSFAAAWAHSRWQAELATIKEEAAAEQQRLSDEKIAEANARAAEANKIAEGEKLARIKLEEKIRPRVLNQEQQAAMVSILKDAPKGPIFINPDWNNPEAKIFAAHIASAVERAGFAWSKLTGPHAPLSYGKLGAFLVIRNAEQQPPHLKPLHDALSATGYDFLIYEDTYVPEGAVLIGVSAK